MIKRITAAVLCLVLLLLFPLQVSAQGANANTPQTHPNTYTNTGNQRADIIGVAKTQEGYLEGAGNNTKYGAALNINMLGWCGAFVSWCAIQAGVPDNVLVKTGVANPASYGLETKYYPEYIPKSGDLFFTMSNSHVGLVYYLDGEYFYSIEGNTYSNGPEGVYIRRHKLSEMKYGSPNYGGDSSANHKYVQGSDDEHPHNVYFVCSDCGHKYYTGASITRDDCVTCKQNNCSHSYGNWSKSNDSQHSQTCTKCGKVNFRDHSWDGGKVTKPSTCNEEGVKTFTCKTCGGTKTQAVSKGGSHTYGNWTNENTSHHVRYCKLCNSKEMKPHSWDKGVETKPANCLESGIKTFTCTDCGTTKESTIAKKWEHNYSPWTMVDEKKHTHACLDCGREETKSHSFSNKYSSNAVNHWYACKDCGLKTKEEKHQFGDTCDSPCKVCKYQTESGHHFVEEWSTDATSHWYACQSCDIQGSSGNHVYESECDDTCDTCLYVREIQHKYGESYISDGTNHWYECQLCGKQDQVGKHIQSEPKYEGAATYCTVCELMLTEEKDHEHSYADALYDETNHWGVCVCGEILESQPHSWSMKTGTCAACGALRPETPQEDDDMLPWILGGIGLGAVVIFLSIMVVVIVKKNKKEEELPL